MLQFLIVLVLGILHSEPAFLVKFSRTDLVNRLLPKLTDAQLAKLRYKSVIIT